MTRLLTRLLTFAALLPFAWAWELATRRNETGKERQEKGS